MNRVYEIPQDGADGLRVGNWVEIFEAYGDAKGSAVQVREMRIGGKRLHFIVDRRGRLLRPHEGKVTRISRGPEKTQFNLHL